MAYDDKGLQVGPASGTTGSSTGLDKSYREAAYVTNDSLATVAGNNYFNNGAKRLPKGMVIKVLAALSGTPDFAVFVVASNNGTTVVVARTTAAPA